MRNQITTPNYLDTDYNWERPLASPGSANVDFEERVDFKRLHTYRVSRTRAAVSGSGLGSMLCFDNNNIRYITSSVIGEWARDKVCRYALIAGSSEPYLWDFGSAAAHHRLYAPWLREDHCKAGMLGLRGSVPPEAGLFKSAAKEIKEVLQKEGPDVFDSTIAFIKQCQRQKIKIGVASLSQNCKLILELGKLEKYFETRICGIGSPAAGIKSG